jgi:hypothetical protein
MTLVISKGITLLKERRIPTVLGEPWEGGFFAGYISHTADGNPTHALIVAPRATGATGTGYTLTTNLAWKTANTTTTGAASLFDGVANTAAMVTAGIDDHPAAKFCVNLNIAGFTDWYLPSILELDIAYFNLKPTADQNFTTVPMGVNSYAIPPRATPYTLTYPAQTSISLFNTSAEAFATSVRCWSSTDYIAANAALYTFGTGRIQVYGGKTDNFAVRAFRRIAL